MGERKGQNKYFPPDFDPRKHRSLDHYHGTHPLRERARKLHQGILIIRFEMPYNIWCDGCGNHIGMGVRYNAEKSKIGMYYTTPIYKFRMKCHLCDNYMEIKTDPANHDYVIISGARRKEQRWDPKENEQIVTDDKQDIKKMASDAMYKLEHGVDDKQKIKSAKPIIHQLQEMQHDKKDDYLINKLARNKFREEKKVIRSVLEADTELLQKSSLNIKLLKEDEQDKHIAKLLKYRTVSSYEEKEKLRRDDIANESIFTKSKNSEKSCSNSKPAVSKKDQALTSLQKKLGISTAKNNLPRFGSQTAQKDNKNIGVQLKKTSKNMSNKQDECSVSSTGDCKSDVDKTVSCSDGIKDSINNDSALGCLMGDYGSSDSDST